MSSHQKFYANRSNFLRHFPKAGTAFAKINDATTLFCSMYRQPRLVRKPYTQAELGVLESLLNTAGIKNRHKLIDNTSQAVLGGAHRCWQNLPNALMPWATPLQFEAWMSVYRVASKIGALNRKPLDYIDRVTAAPNHWYQSIQQLPLAKLYAYAVVKQDPALIATIFKLVEIIEEITRVGRKSTQQARSLAHEMLDPLADVVTELVNAMNQASKDGRADQTAENFAQLCAMSYMVKLGEYARALKLDRKERYETISKVLNLIAPVFGQAYDAPVELPQTAPALPDIDVSWMTPKVAACVLSFRGDYNRYVYHAADFKLVVQFDDGMRNTHTVPAFISIAEQWIRECSLKAICHQTAKRNPSFVDQPSGIKQLLLMTDVLNAEMPNPAQPQVARMFKDVSEMMGSRKVFPSSYTAYPDGQQVISTARTACLTIPDHPLISIQDIYLEGVDACILEEYYQFFEAHLMTILVNKLA